MTHTIFKPDELKRARPIAVNAFSLVLANDAVLECSTLLQKEDGIGIATLSLIVASPAATVVLGPTAIKGLAGGNGNDLAVGFG